jgi:hypothetical protein
MGILDDAIREHLDLKRRHGAREAELKQLEDEVFGPPSRPGEPDFPEPATAGPREETGEVPLSDEASEAPTELAPAPPLPDVEAAPPADVGAPGPATEAVEADSLQEGTEALREPRPEGADEEPEGPLYDHAQEEDFDLGEIELELEDELAIDDQEAAAEEAAPPPPDQPIYPEGPPAEEAVGEETPAAEMPVKEPPVEEAPVEEAPVEEEWAEEREESEADSEDVLEETPEFLRDAPEDEELWFEQGEPQDFDFEDER